MKIKLLVVALMAIVLVTAGCIGNGDQNQEINTKTYTGDGFSFEYPASWVETQAAEGEVQVGDPNSADATGELTTAINVIIVPLPEGRTFQQAVNEVRTTFEAEPDDEVLSEKDVTINGKNAKQFELKFTEEGTQYQGYFVFIPNDNSVLMLVGGSLVADFPAQKSNLALIINSAKFT